MEYYTSEHEQAEAIKRWWRENGKALIFGLVVGIGGLAGYRYWDTVETTRAENASITYEQFLRMLDAQRLDDARETGQAIIDTYPDSPYARLSALLLARLAVENGDYDGAEGYLEPLADGSADSEIRHVANARLARVLLAEGNAEGAAARVAAIPPGPDGDRFPELRGDILAAQGDREGARTMYLEALAQAGENAPQRGAIQLKLDNLAATAAA